MVARNRLLASLARHQAAGAGKLPRLRRLTLAHTHRQTHTLLATRHEQPQRSNKRTHARTDTQTGGHRIRPSCHPPRMRFQPALARLMGRQAVQAVCVVSSTRYCETSKADQAKVRANSANSSKAVPKLQVEATRSDMVVQPLLLHYLVG